MISITIALDALRVLHLKFLAGIFNFKTPKNEFVSPDFKRCVGEGKHLKSWTDPLKVIE